MEETLQPKKKKAIKIIIEQEGKEIVYEDVSECAIVGYGFKGGMAYYNIQHSCVQPDKALIIGRLYEMIERLRVIK